MAAFVDTIAAAIRHGVDYYCDSCARPRATDADWESYSGGTGGHLCWEEPGTCAWTFAGIDPALRAAEAVARLMGLHVIERQATVGSAQAIVA